MRFFILSVFTLLNFYAITQKDNSSETVLYLDGILGKNEITCELIDDSDERYDRIDYSACDWDQLIVDLNDIQREGCQCGSGFFILKSSDGQNYSYKNKDLNITATVFSSFDDRLNHQEIRIESASSYCTCFITGHFYEHIPNTLNEETKRWLARFYPNNHSLFDFIDNYMELYAHPKNAYDIYLLFKLQKLLSIRLSQEMDVSEEKYSDYLMDRDEYEMILSEARINENDVFIPGILLWAAGEGSVFYVYRNFDHLYKATLKVTNKEVQEFISLYKEVNYENYDNVYESKLYSRFHSLEDGNISTLGAGYHYYLLTKIQQQIQKRLDLFREELIKLKEEIIDDLLAADKLDKEMESDAAPCYHYPVDTKTVEHITSELSKIIRDIELEDWVKNALILKREAFKNAVVDDHWIKLR